MNFKPLHCTLFEDDDERRNQKTEEKHEASVSACCLPYKDGHNEGGLTVRRVSTALRWFEFRVIVRKVNGSLYLISALGHISFPPLHPNFYLLTTIPHPAISLVSHTHTQSTGLHIRSKDSLPFFVLALSSVLPERSTSLTKLRI
jgi:hypothetical protein